MKRAYIMAVLFALLLAGPARGGQDFRLCSDCHRGIESLDENHDFTCGECHLRRKDRMASLSDHGKIVRHPASPENMEAFCGGCHEREIATVRNSLHYTLAGLINQTRYLWGAQGFPGALFGAGSHPQLKRLPEVEGDLDSPANLVDDLLEKRCLRCHLGVEPPKWLGLHRGLGCAACHVPYDDDGAYKGGDASMKGRVGYPARHEFSKTVSVGQCLHCHNGPRVGADYAGLFEHDHHRSYRAPVKNGLLPERPYLMDYHHLAEDVHFKAGLTCADCHQKGDVMGRGRVTVSQKDAVKIRCLHCHRGKGRGPPGLEHGRYTSKKGEVYAVPEYDASKPHHSIPGMGRVHCLGCHAAWGFYDYGPSLIRDDRRDLSRWAPVRLQGDPTVVRLFDESGRFLGPPEEPGVWFLGWRFRRWEYLTLGVDGEDRIVPFRPRYQYRVSHVDETGVVVLDNAVPERGDGSGPGWAFMPFYPHTVRPRGRPCEACHGSGLAAGEGLWRGRGPDLALTRASPPVFDSMRLLNGAERKRLLEKGEAYRKWRARVLLNDAKTPSHNSK